jgi:hypothetical protein
MTTEQDVLDLAAKVVVGNDNLDRLNSAVNDAPGVWSTADGVSVSNLRRRLAQVGYQVPVAFESGLDAEDGSFTVIYNGDTYAANPASTPFTTTGTFNSSQWVISFTSTTPSDYGLGDDSGPLIDNIDTWYRGGASFGYGGSNVSATPGDNPFPDLNGLFHLTTVNSSLGVDDDYIHQTAYYMVVATGAVYEARRSRATGVWSSWVETHGSDTADNNFHFLTRAAAVSWCGANTPSVGTEISIYVPGSEQSVVRFAYTGVGSHFTETEFDGWVPTGDVELEHFGAAGNGVTDDAASMLAAVTYVNGTGGGTVHGRSRKYRVATNLTIPRSVKMVGPHENVGAPGRTIAANNVDFDYADMTGALIIDSTVTITLSGNAGLVGWFIYRHGITSWPIDDDTAYAGTAITVANENDAIVRDCLIGGFARAIDQLDGDRGRFEDLLIDCINGIRVNGSQDVGFITRVHCYPFFTLGSVGMADDLLRSGKAFEVIGADWCHLTDCFSYGYLRGYDITANSVVLSGCGADNFDSAPLPNSLGFYVNAARGKMTGCQTAGHDNAGVRIEGTGTDSFVITQLDVWGTITNGVYLISGELIMSDSTMRGCVNGVHIASDTAKFIEGGGNNYESCTYNVTIDATTNTTNVQLQPSMTNSGTGTSKVFVSSGSFTLRGVTSAPTLNLPAEGDTFLIVGATDIDDIAGGYAGRQVTLMFGGSLTVSSSTSSSTKVRLSGNSSYSSQSNSVITLMHTGSYWIETGRTT